MNKNVIPKWLSALNVILLIAGAALDVYLTVTVLKGQQTAMASSIALACACCFGLLYAVYGYQKDVATYATWFYGVFAIAEASKFYLIKEYDGILLPTIIAFACLSVLAIAKNLGKEKSRSLCILILVAAICSAGYYLIMGQPVYALIGTTEIILSFVLLIMMIAKYKDKEARGSK